MTASTKTLRRAALALLVLSAPAGLVGCFSADDTTRADAEAAIAEFNRQYLAAINGGDIEALASLTADDHVLIASGGDPLVGKAALVRTMSNAFERFAFDETWSPIETAVSGDLAYQRGTFLVIATPKAGGEPARTAGNFLRIYRRQPDGRWLMVRDMFNSAGAAAD